MDEEAHRRIAHGRRIRTSLKQSALAPVAVPTQLARLLVLTAGLFDTVALKRMTEAEQAPVAC